MMGILTVRVIGFNLFDDTKDINRIKIHEDSVFTASRDRTIRRWRLKDGKLLRVK